MKILFLAVNLFLSLALMAQSTAHKGFISAYEANTREEKLMGFKLAMAARPKADQDFIQKQKFDPKTLFPTIHLVNGKMVYEVGKRKVTLMFSGTHEVEVDGKKFDFSPGKLEAAYYALEKHFNSQKVGLLDFFIPTAHANGALFLVGAAAAATVGVAVLMMGDYYGPLNQTKLKCENFQHEISILHPDNQEWLIPRIKENMKRDLWNAENNPRCKDGKNADTDQCIAAKDLRECIKKLTPELHRAIAAIDDSGREIEREEVIPEQNKMRSSSSTSAQ